jgi:hypothetical protein
MIGTNRRAREWGRGPRGAAAGVRRAVSLGLRAALAALLGAVLIPSPARGQGTPPPDEATRRRRAAAAAERGTFEVRPGSADDLLAAYEGLVENDRPLFVTTDLVLHGTHRVVDAAIAAIEEDAMLPAFEDAVGAFLDAALFDAKNVKGTRRRDAAAWNAGYLAVAQALFRGAPVDEARLAGLEGGAVAAAAKKEHALVLAHDGFQRSPLFGDSPLRGVAVKGVSGGEDYTAYLPRGHYTRNERLTRYFLGRLYLARTAFPLPEPGATPTETELRIIRQSLHLAGIMGTRPDAAGSWPDAKRYDRFLGGEPDDLTPEEVTALWNRFRTQHAKSARVETEGATEDGADLAGFAEFVRSENRARIREGYVAGMRLLGAASPWDLVAFERLTDGNHGRPLPKGLDVMALLGSGEARARLEQEGDLGQSWYFEAFDALAKESPAPAAVAGRRERAGEATLGGFWLRAIARLFEAPPADAPAFLRDPEWRWKDLVSGSASWAELRHDTILYVKPASQTEYAGDSGPPSTYLEPRPEFYVELADLARALDTTARGGARSLPRVSNASAALLRALEPLARIARAEIAGDSLGASDREHLRGLARTFGAAERGLLASTETPHGAIIADVFGDYLTGTPRFLLVGTAAPSDIVVTVHGGEPAYEGAIATYHEFDSPDRLTDEAWRARLARSSPPALPAWEAEWLVRVR